MTRIKILGPAITVLTTLLYHWLVTIGAPMTTAILFPFVVAAAYISGLRAGLVAALWVSGYAAWLFWAVNPWRIIVIAISLTVTSFMVGHLKRQTRISEETREKAAALDELNGNIMILQDVEKALFELLMGWKAIKEEARQRVIKKAHHKIATLLTLAMGWRELRKEMEEVIKDHEKRLIDNDTY